MGLLNPLISSVKCLWPNDTAVPAWQPPKAEMYSKGEGWPPDVPEARLVLFGGKIGRNDSRERPAYFMV
jgi:hypothetical protein